MDVTDFFENQPDEAAVAVCALAGEAQAQTSVILNREHGLSLYADGALLHRFVCSPCSLGELCAGWLCTEGYAAQGLEISRDGRAAAVQGCSAAPHAPQKQAYSEHASPEEMLALFRQASEKYHRSHGIHACVLKGTGWTVCRTDIGRHNAIDKAVGAAILAGYDLQGATLFTSGRINAQTVEKVARCGVGCLMSKAVITAEALELARELGIRVLFSVKEAGCCTI